MIIRPDRSWFVKGRIHSVDFTENIVEVAVQGDLPPVCPGTYALIPWDEYAALKRLRPNPQPIIEYKRGFGPGDGDSAVL